MNHFILTPPSGEQALWELSLTIPHGCSHGIRKYLEDMLDGPTTESADTVSVTFDAWENHIWMNLRLVLERLSDTKYLHHFGQ